LRKSKTPTLSWPKQRARIKENTLMPFMESSIGGNSFATRLAKCVGVIDSLLNLNSLSKQTQKELKVQITMIDSN